MGKGEWLGMNGRKTSFIGMMLLSLVLLSQLAGFAAASVNPKVRLESFTASPAPAAPGDVIKLTLFLKSIEADNCAQRVSVQLSTPYPLSVQGPDTQYINELCFDDPQGRGTLVFFVPVDALAQSGTYQLTVGTTYEKNFLKFSESNTVNLRVRGVPSFTAAVVSSKPVDIYPGDEASVTVRFANTGNGRADSAIAALQAPAGVEVKSAGRQAILGTVAGRTTADATYSIEALKSAGAGDRTLTASVSFVDEDGQPQVQQIPLSLTVKPKAEFVATPTQGASITIGEKGLVTITLKNTGSQEADKLKVSIVPIYPFSTDGTVRYVESLPAGKETQLQYLVAVDKEGTDGLQLLTFSLQYEDPAGHKFTDSTDFALNAHAKNILEVLAGYWWLLAIAIIAFVVWKKRFAKKRAAA